MSTTVDLSAEALATVRLIARQRGESLSAVASELILKALEPREASRIRKTGHGRVELDEAKAKQMLETAREYVGNDVFRPMDFDEVDLESFLLQYLWVIFVSGFRNAVVEKHFAGLMEGFHDLDLDRIAAMESIDAQTLPIRNQRKADAFLKGCRLIHREGWPAFKRRLQERRRAALRELPYMGTATSRHMALALGIEDTEKPDTWIRQCAAECSATVDEMVTFLSKEHGLTRQQVDAYLWQYCSDHQHLP